MSKTLQKRIVDRSQKGYAIMTVMFFLTLLVLSTILVAPNLVTDVQRQKEEEMIWRGKQYVRAIRLYYGKSHRFPTQLEDLYTPKTGIRFLRQAYKDPMNTVDGSWRLIYIGPNGVLMGSTKNRTLMNAQLGPGFGTPMGSNGNSPFGTSSASAFGGSVAASTQTGNAMQTAASGGQNPQNGENADGSAGADSQQPSDLSDSPNIIGGNIIGVGSKINKKSIIWYEKAKNYRQFEFIWDPSIDPLTGQRIGIIPLGNPSPFGPQPNSGAPGMNPPPAPAGGSNPNPDPNGNPPLQAPPNQ
jgi:type II secretory pathway pseudopilin PulG